MKVNAMQNQIDRWDVEEPRDVLAVSVWSGDGNSWYEPVAFFGPRASGVSR